MLTAAMSDDAFGGAADAGDIREIGVGGVGEVDGEVLADGGLGGMEEVGGGAGAAEDVAADLGIGEADDEEALGDVGGVPFGGVAEDDVGAAGIAHDGAEGPEGHADAAGPDGGAAVEGGGGGVWAAAAALGDTSGAAYADLMERRKALKRERDTLQKTIKAEERKRLRLIEKARGLTDQDLLQIIGSRAAARAKAEAAPKAKAKPKPAPKPAPKGKAKSKASHDV